MNAIPAIHKLDAGGTVSAGRNQNGVMAGGAAGQPLTIAIDGPAAAGKGTLAKRISVHYGLPYLDTGLLYRAVGRLAADSGVDLDDAAAVGRIAATLDTSHLDDGSLRGREAGERASRVAVHPQVRAALIDVQRRFAAAPEGAVLDGRDIGTVICPDAALKLYVTADDQTRAARRAAELGADPVTGQPRHFASRRTLDAWPGGQDQGGNPGNPRSAPAPNSCKL